MHPGRRSRQAGTAPERRSTTRTRDAESARRRLSRPPNFRAGAPPERTFATSGQQHGKTPFRQLSTREVLVDVRGSNPSPLACKASNKTLSCFVWCRLNGNSVGSRWRKRGARRKRTISAAELAEMRAKIRLKIVGATAAAFHCNGNDW